MHQHPKFAMRVKPTPEGNVSTGLDIEDITLDGKSLLGSVRRIAVVYEVGELCHIELTLMASDIDLEGDIVGLAVKKTAEPSTL